ncbi:C2 domain-containing protein 5 isoform X2 [Lycorma delicatula]|uniref:C2 domain-containing protein 5 isoform X2 n=1 Tax=Lycorma delicatula TaxID=130591 RepID=UPI003F5136F5
MSGWFPVYDTMHGIRGEVNIIVKVELFSDFNKFRQSSCGVHFFCSTGIPHGFETHVIHGMVEELVVSDDPEYQWIDKIRTPRASNEARQLLFLKLSGEVQRKIGLKVLDLGGNAVLGYKQCFDLEGESGIVVRGLGTAVTLTRLQSYSMHPPLVPQSALPTDELNQQEESQAAVTSIRPTQVTGQSQPPVAAIKSSQSPAKLNPIPGIHRRSSDSDLSITPKGVVQLGFICFSLFSKYGNSLTGSDRSSVAGGSRGGFHSAFPRSAMFKENLDMLEYPFITMSKFPPGFILHIGGVVTARSVKLLERMTNLTEPESRDSWWTDVRMEVRSHARALGCNVILNYSENTTICDDVCVLSVSGTAAVISLRGECSLMSSTPFIDPPEQQSGLPVQPKYPNVTSNTTTVASSFGSEIESKPIATTPQPQLAVPQKHDVGGGGAVTSINVVNRCRTTGRQRHSSESQELGDISGLPCSFCHIPYNHKTAPFHLNVYRCSVCRKKMVPDILLATIEPPEGLPLTGRGCFLQAFEWRPKKDNRGELNAKEISDGLPFLEFEIHKQLLNKLHISGMNAIFGLKVQICIGEKTVAAHATGTGFLLTPLPIPPIPSVAPNNTWKGDARVTQVQQLLFDTVRKNRDFYQLRPFSINTQEFLEMNERESGGDRGDGSDSEESEDDLAELDPHTDSKESFVLVVDDTQDVDQIPHLIDPHPPDGFHVVTIESLPGVDDLEIVTNLQMFTQVWRSRLPSNQPPASVNKNFHRVLQGLYYKLRHMTPCAFGALRFKIDLPEQDELQISVVGMAVGLAESDRSFIQKEGRRKLPSTSEGDMIFSLEEDQCETGTVTTKVSTTTANTTATGLFATPTSSNTVSSGSTKPSQSHSPLRQSRRSTHTPPKERYGVDLTPLSYVPGGRIEKYLGNLNFFFIRESTCIRESGGLSGFVHSFVSEVLAIVRAHVTALGGNAMVAYFMTDCILLNNPHKNHGQCLVNVGGDAVFISYHED